MKEPFKEKPSKSTKAIEKPSQSKTSTASKAKKQEEHSYAESPKTKNFKVSLVLSFSVKCKINSKKLYFFHSFHR